MHIIGTEIQIYDTGQCLGELQIKPFSPETKRITNNELNELEVFCAKNQFC